MGNTAAIAIGLAVGLFVLASVCVFLFFTRRKMLKGGGRRKVSPLEIKDQSSKSAMSSNSSLRTPKKSPTDSSEKTSEKKKPPERLEIQAESLIIPQKVFPRLTPSDSYGPPIGENSPRSSQDFQRTEDVTPTSSQKNTPRPPDEEKSPQIIQPQPQHPQVLIEGTSTDDVPYFVQRQPQMPMSESPSPPSSPVRSSRSQERHVYAPDEDNPGPYPPAQPAQRRGLSRSSRKRSPLRGRGGRSSSSNS